MDIVILGLSITSAWGNGHATTYRALTRALAARGHRVLFLERDAPWYAANRDLPAPDFCTVRLYASLEELRCEHGRSVREADAVIVGSYVEDGAAVCAWVTESARGVTAFYDIDTPVTLASLERGRCEYLDAETIPAFDLYLSFTGGPTLTRLERRWGARRAHALYCAVDPELYHPDSTKAPELDLGYLGTYAPDRQPALSELLIEPAMSWPEGRFLVAGPQYPEDLAWPPNVLGVDHVPPSRHRAFYTNLRFALNLTRRDMAAAGYAPSVRLFEAAACGVPIISDRWPGLETILQPGTEILVADEGADMLRCLRTLPEPERRAIGERGRERVLREHTAAHRAAELESYLEQEISLSTIGVYSLSPTGGEG